MLATGLIVIAAKSKNNYTASRSSADLTVKIVTTSSLSTGPCLIAIKSDRPTAKADLVVPGLKPYGVFHSGFLIGETEGLGERWRLTPQPCISTNHVSSLFDKYAQWGANQ
jgi:hypothetical protein